MAQRRIHYEQAFVHYLRANRVPYIAVDEAKKTLLPDGSDIASIKSFDFVVYGQGHNMLVDVKGRMFGGRKRSGSHYESWVTRDDVDSLQRWQQLFGDGFVATFVFVYCLRQQPPDALFEEVFAFSDRWYALRDVTLADYEQAMRERSARWQTVYVPVSQFSRISRPFSVRPASKQIRRCNAAAAGLC